ncbi:class I SAM-dependent methyltransferase [Agaricicola taiwanensis]|nr:class I SAM-dependent methyltransferase [Agaricicola taiwanensis]
MRMRLLKQGRAPYRAVVRSTIDLETAFLRLTGRNLREARIYEIGYGQRPMRLLALQSLGYDARGVDLDPPVIRGSMSEFRSIARAGGSRRLVKSAVRHFLFDRAERRHLDKALREAGAQLRIDIRRLDVGNAAEMEIPEGSIDLIYSDNVFEHLPPDVMEILCARMAKWLSPQGVALVMPDVFSGIAGGHLTEWYADFLSDRYQRRTEPWEHLRKRRARADCYLNEFRLEYYRRLFRRHFHIAEEWNVEEGLGGEFLTDEIRQELSEYDVEELLLGRYRFALKARLPHVACPALQPDDQAHWKL